MRFTALAAIPLSLATLGGCGTMIDPGQQAIKYIVLREPALKTKPLPEGFYFQWPWNSMVAYDVTWQSKSERVEVLTADDLHVPLTATVTYRARPREIYALHTTIGPNYYEDVINPVFVTLVRSEFSRFNHNDLARKSPDIEQNVLANLIASLEGKPIDIDRVSIKHIQFDTDVTKSISAKLVKEQEVEQKRYEVAISEEEAEMERATARGRGDSIRIEAEGEAQAIILKGEAQAKAQAAVGQTLTKQYLQYKAFDGESTRYYFIPTGKDGLPVIVNAESTTKR